MDYFISPNHTNFDLMTAIRHQVRTIPTMWEARNIFGHQDDNPFHPLDRWAKLNVEVDHLAKAYLHAIWEDSVGRRQQRIQRGRMVDVVGKPKGKLQTMRKLTCSLS